MGDPSRVILLEEMVKAIQEWKLLENATAVGNHIIDGLTRLQTEHSNQLLNARGCGLYCAIDAQDTAHRDKLVKALRDKGVLLSGNGERTIRLRPALIFQQHHADIFLDIFDKVLRENK